MKKILFVLALLVFINGCAKKEDFAKGKYLESYTLATNYLLEGNYNQAIINFLVAIEIDEKNIDPYLGLYQTYLENGDLEAAENILNNFRDKFDDLVSSNGLSFIYFDLNGLPVFSLCDENGYIVKEIRYNKCLECSEEVLCTRTISYGDNYNNVSKDTIIAKVDNCIGGEHNFCFSTQNNESGTCLDCGQTIEKMGDTYYFGANGHISMRQFSSWFCDSHSGMHTFYDEYLYYENDLPIFSESYNHDIGVLHNRAYYNSIGEIENSEYYDDNGILNQIHHYKDGIYDCTDFLSD